MANDISSDALAKWTFWLTAGVFVAYVAAATVLALAAEPTHSPDTSVELSR